MSIKGFGLNAIVSGHGDELVWLARANVGRCMFNAHPAHV